MCGWRRPHRWIVEMFTAAFWNAFVLFFNQLLFGACPSCFKSTSRKWGQPIREIPLLPRDIEKETMANLLKSTTISNKIMAWLFRLQAVYTFNKQWPCYKNIPLHSHNVQPQFDLIFPCVPRVPFENQRLFYGRLHGGVCNNHKTQQDRQCPAFSPRVALPDINCWCIDSNWFAAIFLSSIL